MGLLGKKRKKKKKSWQRLSFGHKQTKAVLLAQEQATSHRVTRVIFVVLFAAAVTLLVGLGQVPESSEILWVAVASAVGLVHLVMFLLVRVYHREVLLNVRSFARYFLLIGAFLLLVRGMLISGELSPYLIPLPVLAMSLALLYSGSLAANSAAALSVLVGVMVTMRLWPAAGAVATPADSTPLFVVISHYLGSLVAILGVARIHTRTRLVTVGLTSGIVQFLAIAFLNLWSLPASESVLTLEFFRDPGWGFLNGLGSGILITSALPFMEKIFDVTTDMRLMELADTNRPLLREFSLLAPGSFQHSLMVGQLAEEAAQSIGANGLIARVGALYHDIGKMMKPNYFVENQREGENIHNRLSPEMSRLIIISHVKDGIRIADEEGLPRPIINMIPMHHGTSVVEYFYNKKRQQEEELGRSESGREAFQYPGPKPVFREAGILMIADTTEAMSRMLTDPTPARLRALVREVIQKKMATGQLDECELTIFDLSRIEDAFVRVLAAIHHGRIRYQDDIKNGRGGERNGSEGPGRRGTGGEGDAREKRREERDPAARRGAPSAEGRGGDETPPAGRGARGGGAGAAPPSGRAPETPPADRPPRPTPLEQRP